MPLGAVARCLQPARRADIEATYELERLRAEHAALMAAKPPGRVKAGKHMLTIPDAPIEVVPEPELAAELAQLAMEF
jgi:hypothetical protein